MELNLNLKIDQIRDPAWDMVSVLYRHLSVQFGYIYQVFSARKQQS